MSNRKRRRAFPILAAGAAVLMGLPMTVTAAHADLCDQEWQNLKSSTDLQLKIRRWSDLGKRCAGSGLYEARLGTLYVLAGRYEDARTTAHAGLLLGTPYEKDLLSVVANADMGQGKLDSAFLAYQSLMQKFPDYYDGYVGAGAVKLLQGQLEDAVKYLKRGEQLTGGRLVTVYRDLTLAYEGLQRDTEAVAAWSQAYAIDKSIVNDRECMHAAAISYIRLGKLHVADGVLKMLFQVDPQAAQDPEIHKTMTYIVNKLAEERPGQPP